MVFFFNLIYTLLFSYLIGLKYKRSIITDCVFCFCFLYVGLIWILIAGGQYYVGTDYPAYMSLFEGENIEHYRKTGEFIFYGIVVTLNYIGIKGQFIFYFFYFINFLFLILFLKRFRINHIFLFLLLYITYCNIFNNQLNILRQVTAIHICTYATILFCERKRILFIFLILVATGIHLSSFIYFALFLAKWIYKLKIKELSIILFICFICSFILSSSVFIFLREYLPPMYAQHLLNDSLARDSLLTSLTKYMFIPLFLWSTTLLKSSLTEFERKIYIIGFLGFCLRILVVQISIISRISDCFIILTAFPLFFYLRDLKKRRKKILYYLIIIGLISFYGLKTLVFPSAEYIYNSIYTLY